MVQPSRSQNIYKISRVCVITWSPAGESVALNTEPASVHSQAKLAPSYVLTVSLSKSLSLSITGASTPPPLTTVGRTRRLFLLDVYRFDNRRELDPDVCRALLLHVVGSQACCSNAETRRPV